MIQFTSHPYPCCFSKNPIPFTLHAINFSTEISVFPRITLTFNYELLEGRLFYFKYINPNTGAETEARFIGRLSPELDGYEVPANASGAQAITTAYVEEMANHLRADRELSSYYTVEVDGLDIIITAKQAIEELVPTDFYLNDLSSGTLGLAIESTISTQFWKARPRDNHRVNLKVYFEKEYMSNHFEVVSSQTDRVDSNGNLTIDIASIIDSEIRNSFENPPLADPTDPDAVDKSQKGKVLRRFYIEASEMWRNMIPSVSWQSSETRFAHFGGVSMDDYSMENPIEYIDSQKMALTWWPEKKRLYQEQKDWLSWMNVLGFKIDITAKLEILYKDNTSDISDIGTQDLLAWETITVPVGYQQLNIEVIQDPLKEVYGWKIRFEKGGTILHENKYLLLDPESIFTRTLVYLNSLGVPESFVTTGFWDNELQTNNQLATRTLSHDYKSINGQDFVFSKSSKHLFSARSGVLKKKEKKALQDILNVSPVFLLENGFTYPVIIETGNYKINEEEEIIETLEFQIAKSMQLNNISEMIKKPTLRIESNCGMYTAFIDSDEVIDTYNDLAVVYDGNAAFETVSFLNDQYELTQKIETEGMYSFTVEVVIQGQTFKLVKKEFFEPESASFLSPSHPNAANTTLFELMSSVDEDVVLDLQGDQNLTYSLVANVSQQVGFLVPPGYKNQVIESSCLSNMKEFRIEGQNFSEFELSKMKNLELLEITNCNLPGHFSLADFKNLKIALLEDNNLTSFELGLLTTASSINIQNNQLDAEAIEKLVKEVWDYRTLFNPTGSYVYIYIAGNPGVPNMNQETEDISLGTGAYSGDGLVDHDILIIY